MLNANQIAPRGVSIGLIGPVSSRYVCFQRVCFQRLSSLRGSSQRLCNLAALDPLSGETVWVRQDIPEQSVKFGDDQYVFAVLPPDSPAHARVADGNRTSSSAADSSLADESREALVLRAEDGELLGKRKVPNVDYHYQRSLDPKAVVNGSKSPPLGDVCLAKLGRKLLTWRRADAENQHKARLDLFDAWTQQTLWPTRKFDADAHASRWWDRKRSA